MASTTEEILEAAAKLGQMISEHPAAKKMEDTISKLQSDTEAQQILTDYNQTIQTLSQKEAQGQPIEVADKAKLGELQKKVAMNPNLRDFQMVQMDYVDLMRRVDEAIAGKPSGDGGAGGAEAPSNPLITPGM